MLHNDTPSAEKQGKEKDIYMMLLPMVLSICLCAALLVGGTFAWFTATQTTPTQTIQSAHYAVDTTITLDDAPLTANSGLYSLDAGRTYTVTLTATGDASTGYCILSLTNAQGVETLYHTVNFPSALTPEQTSITFTLTTEENVTLRIKPQWSSTSSHADKWDNNGTYTHPSQAN